MILVRDSRTAFLLIISPAWVSGKGDQMKIFMPRIIQTFLILSSAFIVYACVGAEEDSKASTNRLNIGVEEQKIASEVEAKLVHQQSPWRVSSAKSSKTSIKFNKIHFLDERNVYAVSFKDIYKFSENENAWMKVSSLPDFGGTDLVVKSASISFVVGYFVDPSSSRPNSYGHVLRTEDAGISWKSVYSSSPIIFTKIAASSRQSMLAVGRRKVSDQPNKSFNLVLVSDDSGRKWTDVSEGLNGITTTDGGSPNDYLTDALIDNDGTISVVSLRGKIYESKDLGKSWDLIFNLQDEPEQTGIQRLGRLKNGNYWIAGGAASEEGVWSVIVIQTSKEAWSRSRLGGYYFSDLVFLSDSNIIAAGAYPDNGNTDPDEDGKGVILHSSNAGADWSVVHQGNTEGGAYQSIFKANDHKLIVAGKYGEILVIEQSPTVMKSH